MVVGMMIISLSTIAAHCIPGCQIALFQGDVADTIPDQ